MKFLIDGFNLWFSQELEFEEFLSSLDEKLSFLNKKARIVFDNNKNTDSFRNVYLNAIIVEFTPIGKSADDYIIEKLFFEKNRIVITSDNQLRKRCRELKVEVWKNDRFLHWLNKKIKGF